MLYDMLSYEFLHSFSSDTSRQLSTPRLKDGDAVVSNWLANLSKFAGLLFRKYSNISHDDLQPFLHFLINRIRGAHWEDLTLLKEIVSHMSGVDVREDLKAEQMEAHAGGETLKAEAGNFEKAIIGRSGRKSIAKLKESLVTDGVGRSLLLLLAQMRDACIFLYDEENSTAEVNQWLRAVISTFDTVHNAFLQLLRFVREHTHLVVDGSAAKGDGVICIPNLSEMHNDYRVSLETCYAMLRSTITQPREFSIDISDNIEELENGPPISDPERIKVI
jgi:hypothetical protein